MNSAFFMDRAGVTVISTGAPGVTCTKLSEHRASTPSSSSQVHRAGFSAWSETVKLFPDCVTVALRRGSASFNSFGGASVIKFCDAPRPPTVSFSHLRRRQHSTRRLT